jgi:hypothetical protein
MKVGDKVKTWTSDEVGRVQRICPDNTVDVKFRGKRWVDNVPISMCVKIP